MKSLTNPDVQIVFCWKEFEGLQTIPKGVHGDLEDRAGGSGYINIHPRRAAAANLVFRGGSINRPAGHRCRAPSYIVSFNCLPFLMAGSYLRISSAERDSWPRYQRSGSPSRAE